MAFKDYSVTPAANTALGDGTYIGPGMLRNKVRPALQQLAADGKELVNYVDSQIVAVQSLTPTTNNLLAQAIGLNIQGNNTGDNALSAVVVPTSTTKNSYNGFASYVRNDNSGGGGVTGNGVGYYAVVSANANNTQVWGANYIVVDSPTPNTVSAGTSRALVGIEIDMSSSSPNTVIQGMSLLGSCTSNPVNAVGFSVGELSTQSPGIAKWTFGFNVADGVLRSGGAAFLAGSMAASGSNIASQSSLWGCRDGAGASQNYSQYIATNQAFTFASSLPVGTATWQFAGKVNVSGNFEALGTSAKFSTTTFGAYGATPVAKPTGVPVTAAGIHAALVSLGWIAA